MASKFRLGSVFNIICKVCETGNTNFQYFGKKSFGSIHGSVIHTSRYFEKDPYYRKIIPFNPDFSLRSEESRHNTELSSKRRYSSGKKIYTKTGDLGSTSLFTGQRHSKDNQYFHTLGTIDELSSFIGLAKELASEKKHSYVEQLERIQCILQDIGSLVATPREHKDEFDKQEPKQRESRRFQFNPRHIAELEEWIDSYTEALPALSNFILPGGGTVSASLHICRSVCRRAERSVVPLMMEGKVDREVLIYLNRLSDYLFTISRQATVSDDKKETIYIRPNPKEKSKDKSKEE